jgi:8-oxo-dGTP diphosphatase
MTPTIAAPKPGRWCAVALLIAETGRYLMQRRDTFPWINFPDHWACFGGMVEPGESPEAAVRREISEELGYEAREVELFTEQRLVLPFPEPRIERLTFFSISIREAEVEAMVLNEGSDLRLFRPEELAVEPRAVPWDIAAVLMHARREILFRHADPHSVAPAKEPRTRRGPFEAKLLQGAINTRRSTRKRGKPRRREER